MRKTILILTMMIFLVTGLLFLDQGITTYAVLKAKYEATNYLFLLLGLIAIVISIISFITFRKTYLK